MKNCRCVIVDDDMFAIEWMIKYISALPELTLVKFFTNPMEAMFYLLENEPVDLVIMDVAMPEISGLELASEVRARTKKLIFSTSHREFGYDAFELHADGYLLKPYSLTKFISTIIALFPNDMQQAAEDCASDGDFFFAKNKSENLKMVKIRYKDVIAAESRQNYVQIHTLSKKVLTYISLKEMGKTLCSFKNFVQFQRSFIIQVDHIDSISGNSIRMVNGLELTVGEYYRKEFSQFISQKLIQAAITR